MSDLTDKLRRWADIAEKQRSGAAPVDYVLLREAVVEIERLRALHAEIVEQLYGQGFRVLGWHLNGDTQPLDSWFEDNDWLDAETWTADAAEKGES